MECRKQNRGSGKLSINLSNCKYDVIREAAQRLGYEISYEEKDTTFDLFWTDNSVSTERVQKLKPFQRLNHLPGMLEICRKGALSRNLRRMATRMPELYNFYPHSLLLPDRLDDFQAMLRRNKAKMDAGQPFSTWIIKPSAGTMGRGISLVQAPAHLSELDATMLHGGNCTAAGQHGSGAVAGGGLGWGAAGSVVAQAYVDNPLLLGGYKFDLRVYALVLSADPLEVMLYDEGLARFATEPYAPPDPANLAVSTMHLTNYAVNKGSSNFVCSEAAGQGSKRLMSLTLDQVADANGTTRHALTSSIASVVLKTIMSIQPTLAHTYHAALPASASASVSASSGSQEGAACTAINVEHSLPDGGHCGCPPSRCFELLGFDIMFDTSLQPWLLEVNHSPSFGTDTAIDRQVKVALLMQTIQQLGQDVVDRHDFFDNEAKALSERLYRPGQGRLQPGWDASVFKRRPLSALPRSRALYGAAQLLEEACALASGQQRSRSTGSSTGSLSQPENDMNGDRNCSTDGVSLSSGSGNGALNGKWRPRSPKRVAVPGPGRFHTIYPTSIQAEKQLYSKVLRTAAELYPDQRCQCTWCARRQEVRIVNMSIRELTGVALARPASARYSGTSLAMPGSSSGANSSGSINSASAGSGSNSGSGGGGSVTSGRSSLVSSNSSPASFGGAGNGSSGLASGGLQSGNGAQSNSKSHPHHLPPRGAAMGRPLSRMRSNSSAVYTSGSNSSSSSRPSSCAMTHSGSFGSGSECSHHSSSSWASATGTGITNAASAASMSLPSAELSSGSGLADTDSCGGRNTLVPYEERVEPAPHTHGHNDSSTEGVVYDSLGMRPCCPAPAPGSGPSRASHDTYSRSKQHSSGIVPRPPARNTSKHGGSSSTTHSPCSHNTYGGSDSGEGRPAASGSIIISSSISGSSVLTAGGMPCPPCARLAASSTAHSPDPNARAGMPLGTSYTSPGLDSYTGPQAAASTHASQAPDGSNALCSTDGGGRDGGILRRSMSCSNLQSALRSEGPQVGGQRAEPPPRRAQSRCGFRPGERSSASSQPSGLQPWKMRLLSSRASDYSLLSGHGNSSGSNPKGSGTPSRNTSPSNSGSISGATSSSDAGIIGGANAAAPTSRDSGSGRTSATVSRAGSFLSQLWASPARGASRSTRTGGSVSGPVDTELLLLRARTAAALSSASASSKYSSSGYGRGSFRRG